MTLLSEGPAVTAGPCDDVPVQHRRVSWRSATEHVVVVAALGWWATALVDGTGGRDPGPLAVQVALLGVAALVTRTARRAPVATAVAAALTAGAVLVCVAAPARWHGALDVAAYAAAALAYLVAVSYSSSVRRVLLVVCALIVAGFYEFAQGFVPWWGSGSGSSRMVGTFYWHNPFAAYLLAPALLGLGVVVWRVRPVQLAGWLFAPFIVAGVVYSTSRASMAVLAAGWLVIGALALRGSRRHLARWAALTALAGAMTFGLVQSPLFADSSSPLAATEQRATQQDVGQNGAARVLFWRESLDVVRAYPLIGPGFREFGTAGRHVFAAESRTPYVHSGFLQPFADGGIVFGLVFVGAAAAAGLAVLRRRRQTPGAAALPWPVLVVPLVAVLLHSAVDFDWTHPSNLVLTALLAGTLAGSGRGSRTMRPAARGLCVMAVVVICAIGVVAALGARESQRAAVAAQNAPDAAHAWSVVQAADSWPLTDERASTVLLQRAVNDRAFGAGVTTSMWQHVLARTAARAAVDDRLMLTRAAGLLAAGRQPDAVRVVHAELRRLGPLAGPFVSGAAILLDQAGEHAEARELLTTYVRHDIATSSLQTWLHVTALARVAPGEPITSCAWQAATAVAPPPVHDLVPTPPAPAPQVDCAGILSTHGGRS